MKQGAKVVKEAQHSFLSCRVCWRVALATFIAIVLAEAIILIPSYHNYSEDWKQNRQDQVISAARGIFASLGQKDLNDPSAIAECLNKLSDSEIILGWSLGSDESGDITHYSGSQPERILGGKTSRASIVAGQQVLDFIWPSAQSDIPFNIYIRLSLDGLSEAQNSFVWRIGGLVAIISLFATVVTMAVLNRQVLNPILRLRTNLQKAGDELDEPENFTIAMRRGDELGDVIAAFNDMLVRTGDNMRTIRANEKELQFARDNLEIRVQERTDALIEEIKERKEAEKRLKKNEHNLYKIANYDELTSLPNRLLGLDRLRFALENSKRNGNSGALMFIDLDNFKEINDTMGHGMGDELLMQTAQRLSGALRRQDSVTYLDSGDVVENRVEEKSEDIVARIGGDEFMVILPQIRQEDDAAVVAARLSEACATPFYLNHHEVFVTASVGISIFPRDGLEPQELMMCADTALYLVKDIGRNGYRFFSSEMNSKLVERMEVESQLRYALDNQELEVVYQPVVDVATQQLVAVEALLRWENEQLGKVAPDKFIPVAEGTGLIIPIGDWVLEQACSAVMELDKLGYPICAAVNVSTRQFRGAHFVESVSKALEKSGLPADRLELEITESLLVDEQSEPVEIINLLRERGVRFSIDDFGTGYSALSYLRRFAVNTLKIDRSFVSGVNESEQDASLTRTIIAMAKNLGLEIIAEGVEDKQHHEFLKLHDCDFAQGYYFGKPMVFEDLVNTLPSPQQEQIGKIISIG